MNAIGLKRKDQPLLKLLIDSAGDAETSQKKLFRKFTLGKNKTDTELEDMIIKFNENNEK